MAPALPSRVLLKERTQEIFAYLKFLKTVLNKGAYLQLPINGENIHIKKELTHTLKANGYLLLYNVVEATMTQAIADIHNVINTHLQEPDSRLVLDDMNAGLYVQILNRFKYGKTNIEKHATPLSGRLIVSYWLHEHEKLVKANKNPLFSGNVDGQKMLEVAKIYGYSDFGVEGRLKHAGLFKAKNKRNMLAHGEMSFMNCGKDISITELLEDAVGVIRCLRYNLLAIETFLNETGYKFKSYPPVPTLQVDGLLLQPA